MNSEQMQFLADEYADRMMSQLQPLLARYGLSLDEQNVVREALKVTFLEGFGRGMETVKREVNAGISFLLQRQAG